jgi:hypothetical protein
MNLAVHLKQSQKLAILAAALIGRTILLGINTSQQHESAVVALSAAKRVP